MRSSCIRAILMPPSCGRSASLTRRLRPGSRIWSRVSASGITASLRPRFPTRRRRFSVARPDYIARLHAAKYDLRFCEGEQKVEMLRRYREALAEAARLSGISEALLEAAVARDFG